MSIVGDAQCVCMVVSEPSAENAERAYFACTGGEKIFALVVVEVLVCVCTIVRKINAGSAEDRRYVSTIALKESVKTVVSLLFVGMVNQSRSVIIASTMNSVYDPFDPSCACTNVNAASAKNAVGTPSVHMAATTQSVKTVEALRFVHTTV